MPHGMIEMPHGMIETPHGVDFSFLFFSGVTLSLMWVQCTKRQHRLLSDDSNELRLVNILKLVMKSVLSSSLVTT